MPSGGSGASEAESYCAACGEQIVSSVAYCPACGERHVTRGTASTDSVPDSSGVTSWAIGFTPGSTLRNVFVGLAYVCFYVIGVPLLLYAYWNRGGQYRKRTYYAVGILGVGFVAILGLAAVGAAFAPAGEAGTSQDVTQPTTPTPEPVPEFSVRIVYDGSWQGALSVTGAGSSTTESISGSGTRSLELTGGVDIVSVNAQKQDDSGAVLKVQILHEGTVVSEASTNAAYGVAQTSQSF